MTISLYIGHDPRETVGTHVFIQSVLSTTTVPVSITPLHKPMLKTAFGGDVAEGTNAFTVSRFLVPFLQDWKGTAIFMDGADMLLREDLAELEKLRDPYKAVQVVKHQYLTNAERKYVGTKMEADNRNYARKQWASVMLINCFHYAWRKMTPRDGVELLPLDHAETPVVDELVDHQVGDALADVPVGFPPSLDGSEIQIQHRHGGARRLGGDRGCNAGGGAGSARRGWLGFASVHLLVSVMPAGKRASVDGSPGPGTPRE